MRNRLVFQGPGLDIGVLLVAALASPAAAQVTERVSVTNSGLQANSLSWWPSLSADGRYVAFASWASNLVPDDLNGIRNIIVRDRELGTTALVSRSSAGVPGNDTSWYPSISADGRFVAFESYATNLVDGDTNDVADIFVRDLRRGTTERVSVRSSGDQVFRQSEVPRISADGRFVAFVSYAANLVDGDTNGWWDVFVHDRLQGTTERVSVDSNGVQGNFGSFDCAISADGRFVAFSTASTNFVREDLHPPHGKVFVRDRMLGTTELVSLGAQGDLPNGDCFNVGISSDGRAVSFQSSATNLVWAGDTNSFSDVFVRDRALRTTELASVNTSGAQANGYSGFAAISADGRYVAFNSNASNLVDGDTNGAWDVFVRDRTLGSTMRASVSTDGTQGNNTPSLDPGLFPSISAEGRFVAFSSKATNLVRRDTNGSEDVFLRDRTEGPFRSLCGPGIDGVIPCPCANPPSGGDRGCDNSAGTGGAVLSAGGRASVSSDSLVFTTGGEKPAEASVLVQGDALVASGVVYGQGVRCAGGSLKRLYTTTAFDDGIFAPDWSAGDAPVSIRSAALGSPILPGESRWYFVSYRDPIVLGGCPPASTFNSTQTVIASWSP